MNIDKIPLSLDYINSAFYWVVSQNVREEGATIFERNSVYIERVTKTMQDITAGWKTRQS